MLNSYKANHRNRNLLENKYKNIFMWLWNKFLQYIPTFRLLTVNIFHSKKEERKKIDIYCPYLMFGSVHFEWFSLFFIFFLLFSFITKKNFFSISIQDHLKRSIFFAFDVHIEEDWNTPSMNVLAASLSIFSLWLDNEKLESICVKQVCT